MRRLFVVLLLLLAALPSSAAAESSFAEGWYRVSRSVDGDTLWVSGLNRSIRFAGVNAPELSQDCGRAAAALVDQLAGPGQQVYVEPAEFDYDAGTNRYRGYLRVNFRGENWTLEEILLANGLARMDRGIRYETRRYYEWFDAAEQAGKDRGAGIWGAGCGTDVGDGHRANPIGFDCPEGYAIKGNANSMIYHPPGGQFYDRTRPEDCFATEADAQAAGYRRSRA
jgi:micrococcal nuclease